MAVIEFSNVSKRFALRQSSSETLRERLLSLVLPHRGSHDFWAVRDVNFHVEQGQSLGLIGHNGAGKSTVLKLMTRILEPTTGSVKVKGRMAALLELGSGFHPELSGRKNVFLYGSLVGFSRKQMFDKLDEIIDFADIGLFIDTEVKHYSSGMYTRLAFAAATAVDPDILITDEVLAVGDEAFQRKCIERIYQYRREGKTIIFVSHALDVVRSLCDVGVWLDHGVQRGFGPANQMVNAYLADVNRKEQEELIENNETPAEEEINPYRKGSREIEAVKVEFLGPDGVEQPVFRTGEPFTLRIHYFAHQPIERPAFGMAFFTENGQWLTGPNTTFAGIEIPRAEGAGYVDFLIPKLPLLGGRYPLSVAITDHSLMHFYDYHDQMYRVVVQSDHVAERLGIMTVNGSWRWNG